MKISSVRTPFLYIIAVSCVLSLLLSAVKAYEDPAEAIRRTNLNKLRHFRTIYREKFMLGHEFPQPVDPDILQSYPRSVRFTSQRLRQLGKLGGPERMDVGKLLSDLDESFKTLLITSFHPEAIEDQPREVREQHLRTVGKLVTWMHENMDELGEIVGKHRAKSHLARFKNVRDLAGLATLIPSL